MQRNVRRAARALVTLLATAVLAIGSALASAVAFAAVALIVPGTGTPNANVVKNYLENARDRYLGTTACANGGCPDSNLVGINYPASFFPLAFIPNWCRSGPDGCDTWNKSVGMGVANLQTQLDHYLTDTDQDIVVFGYSQGGAVVSNVLQNFGSLTDAQKKRIQVVTIGGIQNPDGGLWPRIGFLGYVPFFDITLTPPMKPDTGVNYTSYGFQYDPVTNAPRYVTNLFADLNALAAFVTVHGYYLSPVGAETAAEGLPYGYTDATLAPQLSCSANPQNCRYDRYGNTYVTIPARSLPIADLILSMVPAPLRPLVKPFVDLASPVFKVLADLGYDTAGDPSVPTPFSPLPFNPAQNYLALGANLATAALQGVQAFFGDLGAVPPAATPKTPVTTTTTVNRALAAAPRSEAETVASAVTVQPTTVSGPAATQPTPSVATPQTATQPVPTLQTTAPSTVTSQPTTTRSATTVATTPAAPGKTDPTGTLAPGSGAGPGESTPTGTATPTRTAPSAVATPGSAAGVGQSNVSGGLGSLGGAESRTGGPQGTVGSADKAAGGTDKPAQGNAGADKAA